MKETNYKVKTFYTHNDDGDKKITLVAMIDEHNSTSSHKLGRVIDATNQEVVLETHVPVNRLEEGEDEFDYLLADLEDSGYLSYFDTEQLNV